MKTLVNSLAIGLVSGLGLGMFNASANLEVSASVQIHATADFYEPLAAHGTWIEVGTYGRCWRPAHVAVEWRPYCYGHWVWTDCGWYWESDEPWGWSCYHYGSWTYDTGFGWVWVPGIEWAPAWVSWRVGGGYCGWAPLPPHGVVIAPRSFVFVEAGHFHEPVRPTTVIVNNTTIINKTTEIASVRSETRNLGGAGPQKVMVNEGPGVDTIQKATGKKIQAVPIHEAVRQTSVPAEVTRKKDASPGKDKSAITPEQPKSAPDSKLAPRETPEPPAKPDDPDKGKKPPQDGVKPSPERPHTPGVPPSGKSSKPSKGKEGKGKGEGGGKD